VKLWACGNLVVYFSKKATYPKFYKNTEKLLGGQGPYLEYPTVRDTPYEEYILPEFEKTSKTRRLSGEYSILRGRVLALLTEE
jgi:hypothetical protein